MSNIKFHADCCGDRYEVRTTKKCPCGCRLFYCLSCYCSHMIKFAEDIIVERDRKQEPITR